MHLHTSVTLSTKKNKKNKPTGIINVDIQAALMSPHLLLIPLFSDQARCLKVWPEIKAGCVRGTHLTPEEEEILFDPTQRASECQF